MWHISCGRRYSFAAFRHQAHSRDVQRLTSFVRKAVGWEEWPEKCFFTNKTGGTYTIATEAVSFKLILGGSMSLFMDVHRCMMVHFHNDLATRESQQESQPGGQLGQ